VHEELKRIYEVLNRMKTSTVFEALNNGDLYKMGETVGVMEAYALERGKDLKNVCFWCDVFFEQHYDLATLQPK